MKILNALELVEFMQTRQIHDVRSLFQSKGLKLKLIGDDQIKNYANEMLCDFESSDSYGFEIYNKAEKISEQNLGFENLLSEAISLMLAGYNIDSRKYQFVFENLQIADEILSKYVKLNNLKDLDKILINPKTETTSEDAEYFIGQSIYFMIYALVLEKAIYEAKNLTQM